MVTLYKLFSTHQVRQEIPSCVSLDVHGEIAQSYHPSQNAFTSNYIYRLGLGGYKQDFL